MNIIRCFVFDKKFGTARFLRVKRQSVDNAFLYIASHPSASACASASDVMTMQKYDFSGKYTKNAQVFFNFSKIIPHSSFFVPIFFVSLRKNTTKTTILWQQNLNLSTPRCSRWARTKPSIAF